MKWHTYLGMFLLGISSAFAATPTNLVIQRVGINVTAPDQLKEIGLFLQQGVIGAVDRTTTHIIDASPEAINTLQIKKLSAITSLVLSQNQDTVVISLVFIDSQGTNDLPRFASFPLSNWMNSLSPAIANISREIASRYPPRPVSMLSTIDVVKTYSPYEVLSNEITIVAGIGYAGTSYKYTGTMNNDHFDVPAMSTSTGPAVDLLLRWRYRKWYNEGWIQSMFSQSPTVLASFSMGYGLLGGVITPLIGGLFSYQEVSFVIKISNITTNLEKKIYFTRGEIMPLFGIRVAFQPTFWVTFFLAPPLVLTLFEKDTPNQFHPFEIDLINLQVNILPHKDYLLFFNWKMFDRRLPYTESSFYAINESLSLKNFEYYNGSVTIGVGYVW